MMLASAVKNMTVANIRTYDKDLKIAVFKQVANSNLSANGRVRATAARAYAEKELRIQTISGFFASPAGMDPAVQQHFSGKKLAHLWEELLDLKDEEIVSEYVRISEGVEAQRLASAGKQQLEGEGIATEETAGGASKPAGPEETGAPPQAG
jgi:hypothetical protein